jgi:hypothetical protein
LQGNRHGTELCARRFDIRSVVGRQLLVEVQALARWSKQSHLMVCGAFLRRVKHQALVYQVLRSAIAEAFRESRLLHEIDRRLSVRHTPICHSRSRRQTMESCSTATKTMQIGFSERKKRLTAECSSDAQSEQNFSNGLRSDRFLDTGQMEPFSRESSKRTKFTHKSSRFLFIGHPVR